MGTVRKMISPINGVVSWQIDYLDPDGKRVRRCFAKKKDASDELAKRVSLIAEVRYLDVKKDYKTRFKELTAKYKENFEHQSSFKNGKKTYLENFKEFFGKETLLSNIRFVDVETYRNHLKTKLTPGKKLRTPASINREMSCLHHLFMKAVEWDMSEKSPFDKGKSLILKENNERYRFLSEDEVNRLLEHCEGHLYDVVVTALNTGMRRGEIMSLKWSQIRNGFIYLRKTKTDSPRQIPINNALNDVFKRIRKEVGVKAVSKGEDDMRLMYVFTFEGKSIHDVRSSFKTALRKANIKDFHFHDLRHTAASHVVINGGSLYDVQELLGHKTPAMSQRYAHLSPERKKKAVNLLNGLTASPSSCQSEVNRPDRVSQAVVEPIRNCLILFGRGERI